MRVLAVGLLFLVPIAAQEQPDEIERLLRSLREPGPEAAAERSAAVDGLLLRGEARAHTALADFVVARFRAGEDPDATAGDVLRMLARHQAQAADPVFGDESTRASVFQLWTPALAELAGAEPFEGLSVAAAEVLRRAKASDRARFADEMVDLPIDQAESAARAKDGVRALGRLRDLGLVRFLARRVEDESLGAPARAALRELTFSGSEFSSEREVMAWLAANGELSYVELAEQAVARVRRELTDRARAESERIAERAARYVEALASGPTPDWSRLLDELRDDADAAVAAMVRQRLAARMAERLRAGDDLGPPGPDRHEFGTLVRGRFTRTTGEAQADWLRLAAAAAVDPQKESFGETAELVRLAVQDDGLAIAALEVLPKFDGRESRKVACDALGRAVDASQRELAEVALKCLLTPGWSAPSQSSALRNGWVDHVGRVLTGSNWPRELRELALDLVILRDESRVLLGEFVPALGVVCRNTSEDPGLRRAATARLPLFLDAEGRQEVVERAVVDLLKDEDPALRRVLAAQWGTVLRDGVDPQLALDAIEALILAERDPRVLRGLLDALRAVDDPEELRLRVTNKLVAAVQALGSEVEPALSELLAESLRTLAIDPARGLVEWQRSIEGLIALGEVGVLEDVLTRRDLRQLALSSGNDEPGALDVVFRAGGLCRPSAMSEAFAKVVVDVANRRVSLEPAPLSPERRLVVAEARLIAGDAAGAAELLGEVESIEVDALRQEARWLLVRAQLAGERPELGLASLKGLGGSVTEGRLADGAYDAFVRASRVVSEAKDAVRWLDLAVSAVEEGTQRWFDAFLDRAERKLEAGAPPEEVRRELEAAKGAFEAEGTPQPVRDRYRALLDRS